MQDTMGSRLRGVYSEAERCLNCWDPPCNQGCPVGIDVSGFIRLLAQGDIIGAAETVEKNNPFGLICGWVCPHEVLCQKNCTSHKLGRAIDIKVLQRYVTQEARKLGKGNNFLQSDRIPIQNMNVDGRIICPELQYGQNLNGKIAVIGAGPSGLACALYLHKMNYRVDLFEGQGCIGGRMSQGIPGFRLDRTVLDEELKPISDLLSINLHHKFGEQFNIQDLFARGYQAIYLATGKWKEKLPGLKGNRLQGVYTADDILIRQGWEAERHLNVAVFGAGNVAMDVARTLMDKGTKSIHIIYRRTPKELTAWAEEREDVWKAGVIFHFLSVPLELKSDGLGRICAVKCARTEIIESDESGRRPVRVIRGWDYELPVDMAVFAVGYSTDVELLASQGIILDSEGHALVDDHFSTNIKGVFAGGDILGAGRGTVVQAVADGKRAAWHIHQYMQEGRDKIV